MNGCRRWPLIRVLETLLLAWCLCEPAIVIGSVPATQDHGQVLYLHTEFLPYARKPDNACSSRLMREAVRQAVLLAARDELGLKNARRDASGRGTAPGSRGPRDARRAGGRGR